VPEWGTSIRLAAMQAKVAPNTSASATCEHCENSSSMWSTFAK